MMSPPSGSTLVPKALTLSEGPLARQTSTQADLGYQKLRSDIIACRLLPGSRLKINELADCYDVSVSAMREALSRLVTEDLVVATAQRGFRASPISADEIRDLTKTRTTIETLCLVDALRHGTLDWESGIVAAFHTLSHLRPREADDVTVANENWIVAHARFHFSLLATCTSPSLLKIREGLHARSERYRRLSGIVNSSKRDLNTEHKLLMDAALARNEAQIAARIEDHFAKTVDLILLSNILDSGDCTT